MSKHQIPYELICHIMAYNQQYIPLNKEIQKKQIHYFLNLPFHKRNDIFIQACIYNKIDLVIQLFPYIDPCARINSAIRSASFNGHHEVVRILLNDKRVDPSVCNNDAMRSASYRGRHEVVKLLLNDNRVDPSN